MGHMKELLTTIYGGGDEAVAAVERIGKDWRQQLEQAASEIERLRAERRWIPVEERLPEEYETVLVATDGSVSAGELRLPDSECGMDEPWWMVFKDKRDRSAAWAGLVPLNDVTHWMPLPEPPEVK